MRPIAVVAVLMLALPACSAVKKVNDDGWVSLFDGQSLDGWKAGENAKTFTVKDGMIITHGNRSHLFYVGPVQQHNFKNFEFKAQVMTAPKANSGIYFHTRYQDGGWPSKGYEAQVNNTHSDPKKTGSLYNIQNVMQAPAKDNEWFEYYIMVNGRQIVIKINDKTVVDYTEPDDRRRLSSGAIALQGHDPGSKVCYRNIMIKPLPD